MDFDLNDKQTYWRDRIRDHNERFLRPRVADYYAEQAVGDLLIIDRLEKTKIPKTRY